MVNRTRKTNILADILQFCDSDTQTRLVTGLTPILQKEHRLDILQELKNKIVIFDDLAYANSAGVALLLKYVTIQDLAMAFHGAPEAVVTNVAQAMSKNMFNDLKEEINLRKKATRSDVNTARERILKEVRQLISENRLYIEKPDETMIY